MTEHTVKEIGHQWIVYVDGLSIAAYATKLRMPHFVWFGGNGDLSAHKDRPEQRSHQPVVVLQLGAADLA